MAARESGRRRPAGGNRRSGQGERSVSLISQAASERNLIWSPSYSSQRCAQHGRSAFGSEFRARAGSGVAGTRLPTREYLRPNSVCLLPADWAQCPVIARLPQLEPDLLRETIATVIVRGCDWVCTSCECESDAEGERWCERHEFIAQTPPSTAEATPPWGPA